MSSERLYPTVDLLVPEPQEPVNLQTRDSSLPGPGVESRGFDVELVRQLFHGQQHLEILFIGDTDLSGDLSKAHHVLGLAHHAPYPIISSSTQIIVSDRPQWPRPLCGQSGHSERQRRGTRPLHKDAPQSRS